MWKDGLLLLLWWFWLLRWFWLWLWSPCSISFHLSPRSALVVSALFRLPCSVRLVFLVVSLCFRSCLPSCGSLCPPCLPSVSFCRLLFPFLLVIVSVLSPFFPCVCLLVFLHCIRIVYFCLPLSPVLFPFLVVTVSVLSPFCFHLALIVSALSSFCFFLSPVFSPFLLVTVSVLSFSPSSCFPSCWSLCPPCLPSASLSPVVSPFLLVIVSVLSPFYFFCLPSC